MVGVGYREQLAVTGHAERKPTLLSLDVCRVENRQRQGIEQHTGCLHKRNAVLCDA